MNTLSKAALCATALALAVPASATDFSFVGTFAQDDEVQLFNFVVGAASSITMRTWSYAGGVNAAGATIAQGGFDPILALFDSTGALINQNDDGGCGLVGTDAETGVCWDTYLTANLAAGSYTASVMQYNNFALGPNLANGFARSGQGNFTPAFSGCSASQNSFEDVSGTAGCGRENRWAFDILNVESADAPPPTRGVPEPSTWAMMLVGFGLVGSSLRLNRRRQKLTVAYT